MTNHPVNVLIVDDDETITWTLTSALRRADSSLRIYQAQSGLEAYGYIQQLKNIDLLITDIHMPQLSGIELLEKIQERRLDTEIIVITGFGTAEIFDKVEKLGAIRYFNKPFDVSDIVETGLQLLQNHAERKLSPGFSGSFGFLNLVDVVQINGLIKKTGLMMVMSSSKSGKIYFRDGDIVHAEASNISGEEAIYQMLCWGNGQFEFKDQVQPVTQTVSKTWEYLILEHCRRSDRKKLN